MSEEKSDWKEKLSFLTPTFEVSVVAGKRQHFYPVSVKLAFKLRRMGKSLVRSLSVLFHNSNQDYKTIDRQVINSETKAVDREVVIEPVSLEMAKYRDEQRAKALEEAIECLTSDENSEILGEIIMDSLREVFDRDPKKRGVTPSDFLTSIDAPQITELLWGVAKANKDILGPLASKVESASKALEKAMDRKLADIEAAPPVQKA